MSIEHGPIVNIEQRRLSPAIETVLRELVEKRPYFTDPGFSEGFGGDDSRIVALKHTFPSPTNMHFTVAAVYEDGSETMISPELARIITYAINHSLQEADSLYVVDTKSSDTTVNNGFTLSRST